MNKLIFFAVSLIFLFTLYRCCSPDQPQKPTEFKRAVLKFNKTDGFIYEGMFDTSKYFRIAVVSKGVKSFKDAKMKGGDTIIEGDLVAGIKAMIKQMDLVVQQRDAYKALLDSLLVLENELAQDLPLEVDVKQYRSWDEVAFDDTIKKFYKRTGLVMGHIEDCYLDTIKLRRSNAYEIWKQEQYNTDPK